MTSLHKVITLKYSKIYVSKLISFYRKRELPGFIVSA